MTAKRLIEKVEGEAILRLQRDRGGKIVRAAIDFPHFRGVEMILQRREALDALALTPRVCGICGHAHLIATARALEACYADAGAAVEISPKAAAIREITLALEVVQNHFKWFYLTLLPTLPDPIVEGDGGLLAAHRAATLCGRAIALLAGQWPHTSYALPGGVMCDPTALDLVQVEAAVDEVLGVYEKRLAGRSAAAMTALADPALLTEGEGDLAALVRYFVDRRWMQAGRSHDRFIVLADHPLGPRGKALRTRLAAVDWSGVEEAPIVQDPRSANFARPVRYRGSFYETGPLARAMVARVPLVLRMHRRYRDAAVTRIVARVREIGALLTAIKARLAALDLSEPSYIPPSVKPEQIDVAFGRGAAEAARGSLLHSLHLRRGRILRYCIITPTQWNLTGNDPDDPGVAQRAMVGLEDENLAETVFKSFDVCAVCTTQ